MPQKTNLNISPYYDDFDKDKQFYKILFKPGYPVQARELTGLQSLLQNQVESFGKHLFKEGSMVIPGGIEYDPTYFSAKINETHLGIDVSIYLSSIISANNGKGTRVRGQTSGIEATIKNFILPPSEGVENITIFIKYQTSGDDGESKAFPDGEVLILEEPLTYGNTTLTVGETVLTLVSEDATATGSAFGVSKGVYFMRGSFVDVPTSLIILEPYNTEPSYRVGFQISEEIINANDDSSLYDNAQGFTNFAAPGADRFKISVQLAKKSLNDYEDTNFVELFRTTNGETKKLQNSSVYSEIKKYFAKRTFDESGNYAIDPFRVTLQDSLNDEVGSGGLYTENQLTDKGNTPTDDLLCVKLSPGKAYVRGFDVSLPGTTVIDVEKPRDTKDVNTASIPFSMGSMIKVNNVTGAPLISIGGDTTNIVELRNERKGSSAHVGAGLTIGEARVYSFSASDAPYSGATTNFDLHLYDIQTFTTLQTNNITEFTLADLVPGTKVRGVASGAIGYLAYQVNSTGVNEFTLCQTTGTFIKSENIIFNEDESKSAAIKVIHTYTTDDIKSIRQNTFSATGISTFNADTVLYDRVLPNFSITDQLNVINNSASVNNRSFAGVGLNTGAIISYNNGTIGNDPHFNKIVSGLDGDGKTITLGSVQDVTGINEGSTLSGVSTSSSFRIKVPRILNLENSGIYSKLPRKNISNINSSNSNLIIQRQIANQTVSSNSLTITSQAGLDASAGITSAFFEPFDTEKYSITYQDGTTEPLTSDQVSITNDGDNITFSGLQKGSASSVTVGVTLKKVGAFSKSKDYIRSQELSVTRTSGVNTLNGLTIHGGYGLRVEDKEISLNVPDVVKVIAIYESKTNAAPTLDKLKFISGLNLDTSTIVGEKIVGTESRAIGQLVSTPNASEVRFVYLNSNKFTTGEIVQFRESNIETVLQVVEEGNYNNRTENYILDKGHKIQYSDYSKIVRKSKVGIPSRQLLVIFDKYQVASGNSGDFFSVNSYTKERFSKDIPIVGNERATDLIDFRPRVNEFTVGSSSKSPFAFISRTFESTNPYVFTPNESSIIGYSYYLPRVDKLVINQFEEVQLIKGESSDDPAPPTEVGNSMEIATIFLPAYLYDTVRSPQIKLNDNKRYTMRDIGALEDRISNLELTTSLNALEVNAQSLEVRDATGLNRFKTGFVVDNFATRDFIDFNPESGSVCDVDVINQELISAVDFWSINAELALNPSIDVETADLDQNLQLLDTNCKKTGDMITLDYDEVDWLDQPQATGVENVNPFSVIVFMGGIMLDPPSDNWTRTIYIENVRTESTGAVWAEVANKKQIGPTVEKATGKQKNVGDIRDPDGNSYRDRIRIVQNVFKQTQKFKTTYKNVLQGPSQEYDYTESIKVTSETDPFMRSRNVHFSANGLKPLTKHYHYLDNGIPDIVPKLVEINMTSGTFSAGESVKVMKGGEQIGFMRIRRPNQKVNELTQYVAAGLADPVPIEKYEVDPYDTSRPAPSESYSATSRLLNIDTLRLANKEKFYGYIVKGAKIIGENSGAVAKVSSIDLYSDNWGDLLGAFFFRDPNTTPKPPTLFSTGTKTFRVTAAPEGTIPIPGATDHASDASGTFTGTGVIQTQTSSVVQLRNPPKPSGTRPSEITTETNLVHKEEFGEKFRAPHRDPLAQSFTVDETGAFLTSFDVFFRAKDEKAKLFVELREVELGTPTSFLVQDYTQLALNPSQINISEDASAATTISFPSPVYLEADKEYALVFLAPASDKYEMWVATMGEKTINTTQLPDVQNVVVSKQYIGGSLFKSQNGTIWTASQYQDLKFKLRKASFVSNGTATFYNTPIEAGTLNTYVLPTNPIRTLPRKLKVTIDGTSSNRQKADLPIGRKVSTGAVNDAEDQSVTGIIEGQGSIATSASTAGGGSGYDFSSTSAVSTINLTGSGSGLTINVAVSNGVITTTSVNAGGTGYKVGDTFTIDNSDAKVNRGGGYKGIISGINDVLDTLYLTDVQGDKFTNNEQLIQYGSNNNTRTIVTGVAVNGDSVQNGDLFSGKVFEVTQYNHAHHGATNQVDIRDVRPDTELVPTTTNLSAEGTLVSVANTTPFTSFGGITTDRGEAIIGEELVSYVVGTGSLTLTRGILNSTPSTHDEGETIQTYEAGGMPLTGINTTFTVPTNTSLVNASNIDTYFLEVDIAGIAPLRTGNSLLCFSGEKGMGGNSVSISQNHQFSSITPQFNVITPGSTTSINSSLRTISGTSASGTEVSFLDQGFDPTILQAVTFFPTPRLVASTINEKEKLGSLPKSKSLTLNVDMTSADPNLSPALDVKNATFILGRNRINNPIGLENYASDNRTKQLEDDPHGTIFITERVDLSQPATSLKVIVGATVQPEADFRVFYRLFTADSSEVSQTYRPFPGYKNLIDTDGDGFGDQIIDVADNDGRADAYVDPNQFGLFSEYQFSVDNLEQFTGFKIKIVMISTNESYPVRLKDFRAIALA